MTTEEIEQQELQELMDAADAEREELNNEEEQDNDDYQDDDNDDNSGDSDDNDDSGDGDADDMDDKDEELDNDGTDDGSGNSDNSDDGDDDDSDFTPIEVEVNGRKIQIDSQKELLELAQKGIDSVNIVPNSDSENDEFMKQGNLTQDDLRLVIAAKGGDKNAIAKLAEMGKLDLDDIEPEDAGQYQSQFNLQTQSEVEKVAGDILADEVHATAFKHTLSSVPTDFQQEITKDAARLSAFSNHIKSGLAEKVIPLVQKELALKGGNFFEAYARIGSQVAAGQDNRPKETSVNNERKMSTREKKMRDRANGSNRNGNKKTSQTEAEEVQSMSDEDFEKLVSSTRK